MSLSGRLCRCCLMATLAFFGFAVANAEVIEEIVAKVEGDIITLSEYRQEEQALVQELYTRFTGEELDAIVERERKALLMRMIDSKILLRRAERLFDLEEVGESFLRSFRRINGLETDEQLNQMLADQGLTLEDLRRYLVARYAPDEILRIEVGGRVSVADAELETFYQENQKLFEIPGTVTLREIVLLAEGSEKERRRTEAEELHALASAAGADFEALARERSEAGTAQDGGKLGPMKAGELNSKIDTVAFEQPLGTVSDIIEVDYGFNIIRVEERTDTRISSYDEVSGTIRQQLETLRYQELLDEFLKKARDEADWVVMEKYKDRLSG